MASLPLHAEKAITARLLGFEALAPKLSLLESKGYRDASNKLQNRLCWFANEALENPEDERPLSLFLADLVEELRDEVSRLRRTEAEEIASCAVTDLATLVSTFEAAPYDLLGRLVAAVQQTAAYYYESSRTAVPDRLWQRSVPVISFLRNKACLSFASRVFLQVSTEFGVEELSSSILLKVPPRWLDVETIATLPRALLHEYIAHVPQGPHTGIRNHPDANDVFAEGWMDYVAHHVHRSVLEQRGADGTSH